MASPTEARELDLVGKVEMRIALAKDDKLESMLKIYLAPLLLKLGSEHLIVRNKVRLCPKRHFEASILSLTISRLSQHASILKFVSLGTSSS